MDRPGGKNLGGGSCSECYEWRERGVLRQRRDWNTIRERVAAKERAKGIVEEDPRRAKRESIFILRGETILRQ